MPPLRFSLFTSPTADLERSLTVLALQLLQYADFYQIVTLEALHGTMRPEIVHGMRRIANAKPGNRYLLVLP